MKHNSGWQKYTTLITLPLLTATAFATSAFAVNTSQSQSVESNTSEKLSLQKQSAYIPAQDAGSCRRIVARSGLYVRQQPTVYSTVLGVINSGRTVTIENGGNNQYVRISAPLQGYVYAGYLVPCDAATAPPPSNCRRVVANPSVLVREQPSLNANSLGVVTSGRRVTIANLGTDGWVPITVPLQGYIQGDYLGYCRS